MMACVTHNFVNIFKLFCDNEGVLKFERFIFDKDFLFVCVKYPNMCLLRIVFEHYEKHYELTEETRKEIFRQSINQMDFSIIEFLLKEKECEEIIKRDDSAEYLGSLLVSCVSDTHRMDDTLIEKRIEIIRALINLNNNSRQNHLNGLIYANQIHIKIIIELISLGANMMTINLRGDTILHNACKWLDAVEYEKLIHFIPMDKLKKIVSIKNISGTTPLCSLVKHNEGTFSTLNIFKEAGADFNSCFNGSLNDGYSVLATAAINRRSSETLRNLVKLGSSVDWKGINGESLLHLAARFGNVEGAKYFVDELGLDVNAISSNYMTPLDYSFLYFDSKQNTEIEKALTKRGGIANVGDLCRRYNLKMDYKELVAVITELLKDVGDDKVKYLRDLSIKSDLEITNLFINVWMKVVGNNSLFDWADRINNCIAAFTDIIRNLEKGGADMFEKDLKDRNFLHRLLNTLRLNWGSNIPFSSIASASFHNICEYLIKHNYTELLSITESEELSTPLHFAAYKIELERRTLYILCNANVSLNQVDKNGNNMLAYAIWGCRSDEILTNLINFGVDWKCQNLEGWNLLHHSVSRMNISGLKYFVKLGLSPATVDKKGRSPLMIYLESFTLDRSPDVVNLLCKSGTDANRKDNTSMTVLDYFIEGWQEDTSRETQALESLIIKGADIYAKDGNNLTFIHKWIRKANVSPFQFHEFVKCLVHKNLWSALEVGGLEYSSTPLHLAVNKMEVQLATLVLLHSVGVNFASEDVNGNSLLTHALIGNRSLILIDMLIKYGADIFHLDKNGRNLLHTAAQFGNAESLSFLIMRATTVEKVGCQEKDVCQSKPGYDVNRQDIDGNTPLHCVMLEEELKRVEEKVKFLLEAGANASIQNYQGHYPFGIFIHRDDMYRDIIKGQKDLSLSSLYGILKWGDCANKSFKNKLGKLMLKYSKSEEFTWWLLKLINFDEE